MATGYRFTGSAINKRTHPLLVPLLIPLLGFALWSGPTRAAPQERSSVTTQETPTQQQSINQETAVGPAPPPTHAKQEAPTELMIMAVHETQKFIGKTLVLVDQAKVVKVGPVQKLLRRKQDKELYLIVDAATFFNSPTLYAVQVKDIARMEGDTLVIPEAPGMHLKGLQYYPDDYSDKLETP